ncbi:hypothetical protein N7474_004824 [Penicillium riverlandense]|uniref:uncharacterized protein n=1 Tax=Penicillium riverlandense TaxID=1903569 RepID=UPI002549812F|nr:uncharacterized protein N7474_004824 [Penicillium riverlandense]KAJ5819233.1 hypothetical protein N7474_004824 [Penicillium riverlandense]
MPGPGGGPPRKSHTKSRTGCKTCKRRHIRCDETSPQCRNCTKHNCRCDYQDAVAAEGSPPAPTTRSPDLLMSPEIEMEIDNWHRTGVPPYPELIQCPRSGWSGLSKADLRLIHHIIGLSIDLHRRGLAGCTVWAQKMPNLLAISLSYDFVMSSILALSAFHLAFITRDQETRRLAYHHRGIALQGLQTAIGSFSKENCDAILAASILLLWLAGDHQSWASLQQGISTVLESMHPFWRQQSELARLVEDQRALNITDLSPRASEYYSLDEEMVQLDQTIQQLKLTKKRVSHNPEHSQRLGELLDFVQKFREDLPTQTPEQSFERSIILRQWLFWLPPSMLRGGDSEVTALAIISQFFAVGITLDRFFPEMGGAYLGSLSVGPIEEMYRIIVAHSATDPFSADLRLALSQMDLPRRAVARPSSPYLHALHEYPLPSSSSPVSASPSHAAYTPPLQSPPAVTVAGSPFHLSDGGGYITAAPSHHSLYPPSPHLQIDTSDVQLGLPGLGHHAGSISPSSAFTPPYVDDICADMPRADGTLGLNMVYPHPQTHSFEVPALVAPDSCWT